MAAAGDLLKLKEVCNHLKLIEIAHIRGKIEMIRNNTNKDSKNPVGGDIPKHQTPTSDWNPLTYAIAFNKVDVVKYFAEHMKCNMRLCLTLSVN